MLEANDLVRDRDIDRAMRPGVEPVVNSTVKILGNGWHPRQQAKPLIPGPLATVQGRMDLGSGTSPVGQKVRDVFHGGTLVFGQGDTAILLSRE